MNLTRTVLVGLGWISFHHLAKLQSLPDVEIVGLCDKSETLARAVSDRFGVGPPYASYEQMLAETQPDVVHVLTPPQTHHALTLEALGAGAHVFVEKPITPTFEEYAELREAATRQRLLLVENYTARFSRGVLRSFALVASGRLGRMVNVQVSYGSVALDDDRDLVHFAHRLPGGALQDFASHPVSLALLFMQEAPASVSVSQRRISAQALSNDELRALLSGDETTGFLTLTGHVRPPHFTVQLQATKGTLHLDVLTQASHVVGADSATVNSLRRGTHELTAGLSLLARAAVGRRDAFEGLGTLLRQFYEAIRTGGPPPISSGEMDAVNRVVHDLFSSERQL